jgi:hypothetical protein
MHVLEDIRGSRTAASLLILPAGGTYLANVAEDPAARKKRRLPLTIWLG